MSTGSPKLARREQAIAAARRRLRRLEVEQHRIKAALARLEADYEDDVADWLSRKLRRRGPTPAGYVERDSGTAKSNGFGDNSSAASLALDLNPRSATTEGKFLNVDRREGPSTVSTRSSPQARAAPDHHVDALPALELKASGSPSGRKHRSDGGAAKFRKATSPLLCSFALHLVVLSLCLTITIATIARQEVPLLSTPADVDESFVDEFNNVEIPPTKFEDAEIQNVVYETPDFNMSDRMNDLAPPEFGVGTQPLGDIGQLDALPSELGTLMAGAGAPGRGAPGGARGEAIFFGARSKGDRFVFVVDNSSSMKGGRLETATAELLNATNALSPQQSFYVIFVSDQTYPMFMAIPPTMKQGLVEYENFIRPITNRRTG